MDHQAALGELSRVSAGSLGVFRGSDAVGLGVSRKQLTVLKARGVIERMHVDTYRLTAVAPSSRQRLHGAMLWAGGTALVAVRSAGEIFGLQRVHAQLPEIVVPRSTRVRDTSVIIHRSDRQDALMARTHQGFRVTGVEATLVALAAVLDGEAFEIACEDARRRRLTTIAGLQSYISKFAYPGHAGIADLRRLVEQLDPVNPARSTLEVKTRRLLVANGFTDFVRELPLEWNGRTYYFDFAFERGRTILETNGRRWHDDPSDYEHDNEKWSVPARYGYRLVFATWGKVTRTPEILLADLAETLRSGRRCAR